MLNIISCAYWPSVCLLWNVCLKYSTHFFIGLFLGFLALFYLSFSELHYFLPSVRCRFANMYNARAAQYNYERAVEQERSINDNANLDIFTAYHNYKTALNVLTQTETLLKSATESEKVTAGMYKVGRATMLDWQTAQSELVDAEKQNNAAKYDLFTKRAAVALAVGDLKLGLKDGENK